MELPPWALVMGETPHDWLLPQCAAVVHHGGAGTVAAGLSAGCPTTVIYFFGDCPACWASLLSVCVLHLTEFTFQPLCSSDTHRAAARFAQHMHIPTRSADVCGETGRRR